MSRVRHGARLVSGVRLCTAALPLALAACGGGGDRAASGDVGGTVIIAQPAEPTTLFPPRAYGTVHAMAVVGSVFDRLAEIGPELETIGDRGFQPRLARSWEWAADSLSIAFQLDPAARWHDGAPLRAEDVRFTFATYTNDSIAAPNRSLLGNIDSVSTRDSLTAVFWFKRRMPQQFLDATYHMYIMPSHILGKIAPAAMPNDPFARNPIGTGRFRFARWEQGARLEIVADTANARGRAKLDRVVWSFAPDFGAATVKLFAGEADFFENIRPENLPQVATTPTLRLAENRSLQYGYLGLNLDKAGAKGTPNPMFADVRVRRALAMAIDRERLARNVFDSLGLVAITAAPRSLIPDTTAISQVAYDPAGARALLDSTGWRDADGDGVREKNGVKLAFDILAPSSSKARERYAVLLQEQFRAIGVEARPQMLEINALVTRMDAKNFDAVMGGWSMNPGRQGMRQTWTSTGAGNCCAYRSPVFDALLDSALTTFDPAKSRAYWARVFQTLNDDLPGIWLYEQRVPVAIHRRIRNAVLRADAWYAGLADWTIDPAERLDRDRIGLTTPR